MFSSMGGNKMKDLELVMKRKVNEPGSFTENETWHIPQTKENDKARGTNTLAPRIQNVVEKWSLCS